jgi:protein phosphatase
LLPKQIETFGKTDRGRVRPNNEDQFLAAELDRKLLFLQSSLSPRGQQKINEVAQGRLFMVADGMGGYEGGEIASAVAVDAMAGYALAVMPWLLQADEHSERDFVEGLRRAMQTCHERVQRAADERDLDRRMGTTLTMAYVSWPELFILHAGDSRAYLLRRGEVYRLTRDHTLGQRLVDQRIMTEEEALRSRYQHVLLNTVGGQSERVNVEFHHMVLQEADELMLCTDGLTGELSEDQIGERWRAGGSVQSVVENLVAAANESGGGDNVTVVMARF